jgi:two-component system, chemotaxis family, protein-glutamate methylesterase/glutaminase
MTREDLDAIVVGGSAGSLEALSHIFPALPKDFPVPILVVVHMPPDKRSMLPEVLQNKCAIAVREARDKEPIQAGTAYFAPPDYHLLVESDGYLSLSYDEPQLFSRPSIDVLFESAADVYGARLLGIILSGANSDGAAGLRQVVAEGGMALVQSPESAHADAMPLAALAMCSGARSLDMDQIAQCLKGL